MTVAFVMEVPAPYRTPLFDLVSDVERVQVFYCLDSDPWRGSSVVPPGHEVMKGWSFGGKTGGVRWKINPSVWRKLSSVAPDVVVVNGYAHPTMQLAMLWCRLHDTPYLIHCESHDLTPRPRWKAVKDPLVRFHVKGASAYLPVCSPAARYLERHGADADLMFMLPNSPNVGWFAKNTQERKKGNHRYTFLFVGRLVEAKDVKTLISAFRFVVERRRDAHLVIAGTGPLKERLQEASAGVEGITFRDFVPQEELPALYAQADCFVLPSVYEPFGVVVIEALASRLPVIASDRVGAAMDAIDEGRNGALFKAGDPRHLAEQMVRIMDSDQTELRQSAARSAARFDYSIGMSNLLAAVSFARREQERERVERT